MAAGTPLHKWYEWILTLYVCVSKKTPYLGVQSSGEEMEQFFSP